MPVGLCGGAGWPSPRFLAPPGSQRGESSSADAFDDLDQLVHSVALMTGELDKLPRSLNDRTPLGRSGDRDATTATELKQSLFAEQPWSASCSC
jgi:hypothetical protein